jgi:hypothetical protein
MVGLVIKTGLPELFVFLHFSPELLIPFHFLSEVVGLLEKQKLRFSLELNRLSFFLGLFRLGP